MSADDNSPEQAREVEVVAEALRAASHDCDYGLKVHDDGHGTMTFDCGHVIERVNGLANADREHAAAHALAILAPIREGERQEAAREARETAWDEFVQRIATHHAYNGAGDPGQRFYDECLNTWLSSLPNPYRADGVTGRGEGTDHEQQEEQ